MFAPGPFEIIVFLTITLLLFGNRLPDVARSIGSSFNSFRQGLNEVENQTRLD